MRCEQIPPDSSQWLEILAAVRHDFYHLPSYARLAADTENGTARAFVVDDPRGKLIVPLVIRAIDSDRFDAISPYGYAAPLWSPTDDLDFAGDALAAFVAELRNARIVSAFVRLHPLLTTTWDPFRAHGDVILGGQTVHIDLSASEEDMWKDTRENHRRTIRRAQRSGFVARLDANWDRLADFIVAYGETMTRVAASERYFFSDRYFTDLRAALGERLHLLVVENEDRVAAAALFAECCGLVQYHLGGTRNEFLAAAPMKLLFHFARTWFKERRASVLHLGGGVGAEEDSLFHFKAGFSSGRARFSSWRIVSAPVIYRDLVGDWCHKAGREPNGAFFPSYREPL